MSEQLYTELQWLPRPPEDFSKRCRALREKVGSVGREIRALASFALDENKLVKLANCVGSLRSTADGLQPLIPFRLGIISNATSHFMVPALIATAARYGIALECIEANYGQVMQEALAPDSMINRARPDAVLVAIDYRGLALDVPFGDSAAAEAVVAAAIDELRMLRDGLRKNSGAGCIFQTLARPVEATFGSLDLALPGTSRNVIDLFNRALATTLAGKQDLLLDVGGLAETVGLSAWHDSNLWNIGKIPFANSFLPIYADLACRLIAALRGKSRRCLVLDLDNTLWGGVIGDDGLEGIVLGQGDPQGEAHLGVQRAALGLRERGIVLAVSSKNNDEIARLPFQKHPEMLLRENHLAVFQANWNDKATNIQAIAAELSLGLESLVFLDDNPAERRLVRDMLPDVAVPELPDDPALYVRTLLAAGYFEAITYSPEDQKRADFYQDNARRVALQRATGDLDAYLATLNMTITFQPFDEVGRARIAQLINKSNQFNLTTRRYSEAQVGEIETDPTCFTLQVRLVDTFGDNGMISVIICRQDADAWLIDTWLMSCRVLGRRVEQAVLQELLIHARSLGIGRLIGTYRPTERNRLVEDHYSKLGFAERERNADGSTVWSLDVAGRTNIDLPMKVVRIGNAVGQPAM
ncbi:MAG TPA: HAD-IIIC family phosphatase [Steroidobacteraceae bacterium]|jgi:FkbH-like protein